MAAAPLPPLCGGTFGSGLPPGPTPYANWVVPGRLLAGAYPGSLSDEETEVILTRLLADCGVNTFVCLQAEVSIHVPEHSWRAGAALRPYIKDAQRLLSHAQATGSSAIRQRKIDFLHLPIIDGSVTTDAAMSRLADDCCERVLRGEVLYAHCWGGHGRTGTLVAVMLGRLYDLPYAQALRHTQACHDTRTFPQGVRSPQTAVQRAQVKRLLLLPSAFCGAAGPVAVEAAAQAAASSGRGVGSPAGVRAQPGTWLPATPAKQPVVPVAFASLVSAAPPARPAAGSSGGAHSALRSKHAVPSAAWQQQAAQQQVPCSPLQQAPPPAFAAAVHSPGPCTAAAVAALASTGRVQAAAALLRTPQPRAPGRQRAALNSSLLHRHELMPAVANEEQLH